MVLHEYTKESSLLYSEDQDAFVLELGNLPFVWAYDGEGPAAVWRIEDYTALPVEYDPTERSVQYDWAPGHSDLRLQGLIAGRFVVLTVRHRAPREPRRTASVDYYALDLTTSKTYFVGNDERAETNSQRTVLLNEEHQVLVEGGAVAVMNP